MAIFFLLHCGSCLRSPTKITIIWHSNQIKTFYNQWSGVVLWNSLSKIFLNIHRKMSAMEFRLHKVIGSWAEPFWFFESSNSAEHMRISKVVAFKVAFIEKVKSLFRSSVGYLEPGRISTMKLLAVNFRKKLRRRCSTGF